MYPPLHGVAPLPHLGVIRIEGDDATTFLQGQLTSDVGSLSPSQARLAAFCNAKGRMQASFFALHQPGNAIALVMSRDLLVQTLKRLSMFVMRAKARLSDATESLALFGLAGEAARVPGLTDVPWSAATVAGATAVALYPADGAARALWVAPAGSAAPAGTPLDPAHWLWGEVRSGIATVTAPVFESFVPQMLNYESVGGVNFKKGCYPGQEVVARSQFRGTLKRRAFPAHAAQALAAGQELFHSGDPTQPCGLVAQAAPAPEGGWDAIVSIQLTATGGGEVHVGSADGPVLQLQALPYPLLADV